MVINMNRIMECVPNYSEGRDLKKVDYIVEAFRGREGVKLLDYSSDYDHNRTVVTLIGEPEKIKDAVVESVGRAVETIDMRVHTGQHPRMGAVDVIPFISVRNCTIEDADTVAKSVAKSIAERFCIPCFLYEKSASATHRVNLADVRKGQFEGLEEKMRLPEWQPDFGPYHAHPTAGAVAIGARMPLVAYNINLDTSDMKIATAIAKKVRYINGGLRFVKALGVKLEGRSASQVSMNLTDFTHTAIYTVFEMVKMEAKRYGVRVLESEIVGLLPLQALSDCAEYYLQLRDFSTVAI